ncbi:MAG TPA: hypothetical protein DDW30_07135 [Clostridiales bacterium]|nr:hypothetical protein [Clostridiales bacterium]
MNRQADRLLGQARKNREVSARHNAFFDIFRAVSGTAIVRLWMEILSFLRRFRMLRIVLQVIGWFITVLQAGTLIVLTTIVFFVLLPLLAVLLVIVPLIALLDRRKSKRRLSEALSASREVMFFFTDGPVTAQSAIDLARDGRRTVLLVSPHWISGRATDGSPARLYVNLRRESEHVFLIRRYFYFSARKMVGDRAVSLIY